MPHIHEIKDAEAHFIVDATTREITNTGKMPALVQNDHNSERLTFVVPRYVDGHDMSLCDKAEVLYKNIQATDKTEHFNRYLAKDLKVNPDDDNTVILSWLITDDSTQLVGNLDFSLRFYCKDNYVWNTKIFSEIKVAKGMPKTNDQETSPEETVTEIETILYENNVEGEDTVSKVANVIGILTEIDKLIEESEVLAYANT